ncbi:MAG: cell division protein FtsZ [Marinifilaceae bacterium]|jgi:cell division protein FtsZ|nr:cell division protein FtsZ [Marinifilaceae bacterium]
MRVDILPLKVDEKQSSIIKLIGVGGGGSNAVEYMYNKGIEGVDFVICNTDVQALNNSKIPTKIQLGESLTEGRGAGNRPNKGEESAIESLDKIDNILSNNTKMIFITAGMGGGTGTGAAPIIAKIAKERNILCVAIVTIPFEFEGSKRIDQAIEGISKLDNIVDALLIINNEKLRKMFGDRKLSDAFKMADNVLGSAAKSIAEIITGTGYINVDFADIETVMRNSGVAVMGSAKAEGKDRAIIAVKEALKSPLLNNSNIRGAKNILLNIKSGKDEIKMSEITIITDYISSIIGVDANIIWGNSYDSSLNRELNITIIATAFQKTTNNNCVKIKTKLNHIETKPNKDIKRVSQISYKEKFKMPETPIDTKFELENKEKIRRQALKEKFEKEKIKEEIEKKRNSNKPDFKRFKNIDAWLAKKFGEFFDNSDTVM